jgi:hypothetical protein
VCFFVLCNQHRFNRFPSNWYKFYCLASSRPKHSLLDLTRSPLGLTPQGLYPAHEPRGHADFPFKTCHCPAAAAGPGPGLWWYLSASVSVALTMVTVYPSRLVVVYYDSESRSNPPHHQGVHPLMDAHPHRCSTDFEQTLLGGHLARLGVGCQRVPRGT